MVGVRQCRGLDGKLETERHLRVQDAESQSGDMIAGIFDAVSIAEAMLPRELLLPRLGSRFKLPPSLGTRARQDITPTTEGGTDG